MKGRPRTSTPRFPATGRRTPRDALFATPHRDRCFPAGPTEHARPGTRSPGFVAAPPTSPASRRPKHQPRTTHPHLPAAWATWPGEHGATLGGTPGCALGTLDPPPRKRYDPGRESLDHRTRLSRPAAATVFRRPLDPIGGDNRMAYGADPGTALPVTDEEPPRRPPCRHRRPGWGSAAAIAPAPLRPRTLPGELGLDPTAGSPPTRRTDPVAAQGRETRRGSRHDRRRHRAGGPVRGRGPDSPPSGSTRTPGWTAGSDQNTDQFEWVRPSVATGPLPGRPWFADKRAPHLAPDTGTTPSDVRRRPPPTGRALIAWARPRRTCAGGGRDVPEPADKVSVLLVDGRTSGSSNAHP